MKYNQDSALHTVIHDLDSLICELENNPQISSWIIHKVLKSIKEKAERMEQNGL